MSAESAIRRRDPRFPLRPGGGTVRFSLDTGPGRDHEGALTQVSVAGIGFGMTGGPPMTPGTVLRGATVTIGLCEIKGDLSVRQCRHVSDSSTEVGCLFYPSSTESEERWIAVLSGMDAVHADAVT